MVKIISQETFNDAVKENMSLFGLEGEEAIRETVEQFRSQGIELSNIIKEEWCVLGGEDPLSSALSNLTPESESKLESIRCLSNFCNKDISIRLKAAEMGAYGKLFLILKNSNLDEEIKLCLDALCALMDGFPDLLDKEGSEYIILSLKGSDSPDILFKLLEWTKRCCVKHEGNRKRFMGDGISEVFKSLLERVTSQEIIIQICNTACALSLDDDIREAVSGAHIHACTLAAVLLPTSVNLLRTHRDNETQAQILKLISSLLVRDTLCQKFVELGGLEELIRILNSGPNQKVLRHGFNVLACLAGHDEIKDSIVKSGLGPLIVSSLWRGQDSKPLCSSGLSLVARLCLRSPVNSRSLYNVGFADCIVHIMKTHSQEEKIQSSGCLALRNMVSHCHDLRAGILSLGIEKILQNLPKNFPKLADYAKATLLALDCKVQLNEEWTGLHGDMLRA